MKGDNYTHPALVGADEKRVMVAVVESVIFQSDYIQIISSKNRSEKDIIFVPKKVYAHEFHVGNCMRVTGEYRFKRSYGDILIADSVSTELPTIEIFAIYAAHHFPLLNESSLKKIIDSNQDEFFRAVSNGDLSYFIRVAKLNKFVSSEFLSFSRAHLHGGWVS